MPLPLFFNMTTQIKRSVLSALFALFVLGGTFLYLYHRNSVKSQEIAQYKQNWKAAQDSVEHFRLKNGELLAERQSLVLSESELRAQLNISKDEIKDLKKKLGSAPAVVTKVQSEVRIDSIYIESTPTVVTVDTLSAPITFNDNWLTLNGQVDYSSGKVRTNLHNISMSAPLTIGTAENGKFFVSTSNPYLNITDITSVVSEKVVPKRRHWGIGVSIGPSIGYDFHHKDIYWGVGGMVGLQYNF